MCWSATYIESVTQKAAFHLGDFKWKNQEFGLAHLDLTIHANEVERDKPHRLLRSTIRMTGDGDFDQRNRRLQSTTQNFHEGTPIYVAGDKLQVMRSSISSVSRTILQIPKA